MSTRDDEDSALREEMRRTDLAELIDAWEEPMPAAARQMLRDELERRDYRIASLPEPPHGIAAHDGGSRSKGLPRREEGSAEPPGEALARILGVLVGGGAGALALIVLVTYGGVRLELLVGLPGVGLGIGAGAFSLVRSWPWGVCAAGLGCAWTVVVLWLSGPTQFGITELALGLTTSPWGAAHLVLVALVGLFVGAGWEREMRASPGFAVRPTE